MDAFDYVVVGAGSAGCIVASRLSEDPRISVLLIEAGGKDNSPWLRIPLGYSRSFYDPKVNWMFYSEPEPNLGGRRIYAPRGKVQGGSGTINALIFVRGAPEDFEDWRAAGNAGWGFDDVLPYFRRLETYAAGGAPWRGDGGPIHVASMRRQAHPIVQNFLSGCEELGFPGSTDFNAAKIEGAGIYDITTRRGARSSSSFEYLHPALKRPNLSILRHTRVRRVLVNREMRATGVKFSNAAGMGTVLARAEVILAAGAVGTPHLLQHSGIGHGDDLQAAGVALSHHLPAVGRNLRDHLCASFYFASRVPTLNDDLATLPKQMLHGIRYFLTRRGPLALSVNQAGGFFRGVPEENRPNIQIYFNPLSYRIPDDPLKGLKAEPYSGFLLAFNPCRPTSRGRVAIVGPDPVADPAIMPNYLSTDRDVEEALQGCHLVRRLMTTRALAEITREEMPPSATARTDPELLAYFRAHAGSIYHLCGSARMGPDPASSVVSAELKVHGIVGLRVIDASVFPNITSGNINAPTLMVAEKGADLIRSQ